MRLLSGFLFILLFHVADGQAKFDTLFIASKKYPLKKVPVYNSWFGRNHGVLPCEYKELFGHDPNWEKTTPQFKYRGYADSTYIIINDAYGNEIISLMFDKLCHAEPEETYYLATLLDTITLPFDGFRKDKPYIKSGKQKIYFSGAIVDAFYQGIIVKWIYSGMLKGDIFSYWESPGETDESIERRKNTTFILRDLTYRKGNATYYLDRQFVILLK